jgi:hypothetical protein
MSHFAGDILKWGIPSAYNSSTGESNHKMLKQRSNKTQRQLNLMEEQKEVCNMLQQWPSPDIYKKWLLQDLRIEVLRPET